MSSVLSSPDPEPNEQRLAQDLDELAGARTRHGAVRSFHIELYSVVSYGTRPVDSGDSV